MVPAFTDLPQMFMRRMGERILRGQTWMMSFETENSFPTCPVMINFLRNSRYIHNTQYMRTYDLSLSQLEDNSLRISVKIFAPVDQDIHLITVINQCGFHGQWEIHPHVLSTSSDPVSYGAVSTHFSCQCMMTHILNEAYSLHTEVLRPIGLIFWGADPSILAMDDISPRASGTDHVSVSPTRFETSVSFSSSCSESAFKSDNVHPSNLEHLIYHLLYALFNFSPSSSFTIHSQSTGMLRRRKSQTVLRLNVI